MCMRARRGHCTECGGQGNSPDQPQRDRDPADVGRAEQLTDVVRLLLLGLMFFL